MTDVFTSPVLYTQGTSEYRCKCLMYKHAPFIWHTWFTTRFKWIILLCNQARLEWPFSLQCRRAVSGGHVWQRIQWLHFPTDARRPSEVYLRHIMMTCSPACRDIYSLYEYIRDCVLQICNFLEDPGYKETLLAMVE